MDVSVREITSLIMRRHNSCTCKNMPCVCYMVTTRDVGDIPGCITPAYQKTFCEEQNIDVKCVDSAERYCAILQKYQDGGYPGDFGWRRCLTDLTNVGKIRPVA